MAKRPGTQLSNHQVADEQVSQPKMAVNSVGERQIIDRSVTNAKIGLRAIMLEHLRDEVLNRLLPASSGTASSRDYRAALQNSPNIPNAQNPFATINDIAAAQTFWKKPIEQPSLMESDQAGTVRLVLNDLSLLVKDRAGKAMAPVVDHSRAKNLEALPNARHVTAVEKELIESLATANLVPGDILQAVQVASRSGRSAVHVAESISLSSGEVKTIVHPEVEDTDLERNVIILRPSSTINDVTRDHGHGFWFNGRNAQRYAFGTTPEIDAAEYQVFTGGENLIPISASTRSVSKLRLSFRRRTYVDRVRRLNALEAAVDLGGEAILEPTPLVAANLEAGFGSGGVGPLAQSQFVEFDSFDPAGGTNTILLTDHQGSFYTFWLDEGGRIRCRRTHSSGDFQANIELQPSALSGPWQSEVFTSLGAACVCRYNATSGLVRRIVLAAYSETTGNTYVLVSSEMPDSFGVEARTSDDLSLTFDSWLVPTTSSVHVWYEFEPDRFEIPVIGQGTTTATAVIVATNGSRAKYISVNTIALDSSQAGNVGAGSDSASDFKAAAGRTTLEVLLGQTPDRSTWKKVQMKLNGLHGNLSEITSGTRGGSISMISARGRSRVGVSYITGDEPTDDAVLTAYIEDEQDGGRLHFWIQYLDTNGEAVTQEIIAARETPRVFDMELVDGSVGHLFASLSGQGGGAIYSKILPMRTEDPDAFGTSETPNTITLASGKVFKTQSGLPFSGQRLLITDASGRWMMGVATSYTSEELTVDIDTISENSGVTEYDQWTIVPLTDLPNRDYISQPQTLGGGLILSLTSSPVRLRYDEAGEPSVSKLNAQLNTVSANDSFAVSDVDLAALMLVDGMLKIFVRKNPVRLLSSQVDGGSNTQQAILLSDTNTIPAAEGVAMSAFYNEAGSDWIILYGGTEVVDSEANATNRVVAIRRRMSGDDVVHAFKTFTLPGLQARSYHAAYAISNETASVSPLIAANSGFVFAFGGRAVGSIENDESRSVVPSFVSRIFIENADDVTANIDNLAMTAANTEDMSAQIPASVRPVIFMTWDGSNWALVIVRPPDVWIIQEGSGQSWFDDQASLPGEAEVEKVGADFDASFSKRGALAYFQYIHASSDICWNPDVSNASSKPGITYVLYFGPGDEGAGALKSMVFNPQSPNTFTWENVEVVSNDEPSSREDAVLVYGGVKRGSTTDDHHIFYLYGGQNDGTYLDDVWMLEYWVETTTGTNIHKARWVFITNGENGSVLQPMTSVASVRRPAETDQTTLPNNMGVYLFGGRLPEVATSPDLAFLQLPQYWRETSDADLEILGQDMGGAHIPIPAYVISDPLDISNVHAIKGPLFGSFYDMAGRMGLLPMEVKIAFGFGTSVDLYSIDKDGNWSSPFSIEDIHEEAYSLAEVNRGLSIGKQGTSSDSVSIGAGGKTFNTQAGLHYQTGDTVRVYSQADEDNYMEGTITSYSGTVLQVNVTTANGSGTFTDWKVIPYGSGSMVRGANPAGFSASTRELYIVLAFTTTEPSDQKIIGSVRFRTELETVGNGSPEETWERLSPSEVRAILTSPRGVAVQNLTGGTLPSLRVVVTRVVSDEIGG